MMTMASRCAKTFAATGSLVQNQRSSPIHILRPYYDGRNQTTKIDQTPQLEDGILLPESDVEGGILISELPEAGLRDEDALQQRQHESSDHVKLFSCCNREFGSNEALGDHRRDSPAHRTSNIHQTPQQDQCGLPDSTEELICCNRMFLSSQAFQDHRKDAPAHRQKFECCRIIFKSEQALKQHQDDSPNHRTTDDRKALQLYHKDPSTHSTPKAESAVSRSERSIQIQTIRLECCNRKFHSEEALRNHRSDAPAHAVVLNCCNRTFPNNEALQQHKRDAPTHAVALKCCNRTFTDEEALQQHRRDAPTHLAGYRCVECNQKFKTEAALQQHQREAPAHLAGSRCVECNQKFKTEEALHQHRRDSPAHAVRYNCSKCERKFKTNQALQHHKIDCIAFGTGNAKNPIDIFFSLFAALPHDKAISPAELHSRLQKHQGWQKDEKKYKEAWTLYQHALAG